MSKLTYFHILIGHPLLRRIIWFGYAILFYLSGQAFTIWLLEPEKFAGGSQWFWVGLFPVMVPGFFLVHRLFGCGRGQCNYRQDKTNAKNRDIHYERPPGM